MKDSHRLLLAEYGALVVTGYIWALLARVALDGFGVELTLGQALALGYLPLLTDLMLKLVRR